MRTAIRRYLTDKLDSDPLLRNPDFLRYWFSSVLNGFGSYISTLAIPLCSILLLKATPGQMGIVSACQALPVALLALPAGVWLDRRRKLPVLLCSQAIQGLTLASIPLAWWLGLLSMPWMYMVSFVFGVCSVVGGGAEQVFFTQLVGRDRMMDAQTKFVFTDSVARLVAPGVAGVLIQWLTAPFAVLFNACGFFVSVWNMRQTRVQESPPAPSDQHPLRDIKEGLVFIATEPLLRTLAWGSACWHLLFYGYAALALLMATRELGMTPGMLGAMQIVGGLGVLASAMLVKPLNRRFGAGKTMLAGIFATTAGFVLMPLLPAALFGSKLATAAAYACVTFVFDCGVMLFFMAYSALRVKVTPDALMGRMMSTMRFLTVAIAPLGALAAGYAGEHLGLREGMGCVGGGAVLLAAALTLSRPVRSVRPG